MRNIGKYRLLGILGYGGMARVFKVMHLEHKTLMAMKLLRPRGMMVHLLGDAEIRRRFLDEARMMSELEHPNIAAIHETGEHAGHLFFVQAYFCFNLGLLIGESEGKIAFNPTPDIVEPAQMAAGFEDIDTPY